MVARKESGGRREETKEGERKNKHSGTKYTLQNQVSSD
jgi:hypothetical protein